MCVYVLICWSADGAKQEAHRRVQDAEAAAKRAVDAAIRLRSRAQLYMANAELAAYKSAMALKLAEAISVSASPDLTSSILEWTLYYKVDSSRSWSEGRRQ